MYIGNRSIQTPYIVSEISKQCSTTHVSHSVRPPRSPSGITHTPLRSGNHRTVGLPMRHILGQPFGHTTRGHYVQPDVNLVPRFVRQHVQSVVYYDVKFTISEAGDVRPSILERCRLYYYIFVFQIRGLWVHDDGS